MPSPEPSPTRHDFGNSLVSPGLRLPTGSLIIDAYAGTKRMVQLNQNYQKRYWDYTKIIVVWVVVLVLSSL